MYGSLHELTVRERRGPCVPCCHRAGRVHFLSLIRLEVGRAILRGLLPTGAGRPLEPATCDLRDEICMRSKFDLITNLRLGSFSAPNTLDASLTAHESFCGAVESC